MKVRRKLVMIAVALGLIGGIVAVASPAGAFTHDTWYANFNPFQTGNGWNVEQVSWGYHNSGGHVDASIIVSNQTHTQHIYTVKASCVDDGVYKESGWATWTYNPIAGGLTSPVCGDGSGNVTWFGTEVYDVTAGACVKPTVFGDDGWDTGPC